MDPYLEDPALWPVFQRQLLDCLYQVLRPGLVDRYHARVLERRYRPEGNGEQSEQFIEIHARADNKLVTLLEVVSPANKTTDAGRQAYLNTRREAIQVRAGVVEIDLVLQGKPTLTYLREALPDFNYSVTVTRSTAPDRYEIYTATLQKRLPKFKLPLAPDDRDTLLDLQSAFTRAYDLGGYGTRIDHEKDPPMRMKEEDERWCDQLLRQMGIRTSLEPTDEEIAVAAYHLWQQEGCPSGREAEHWREAETKLRGRTPPPPPAT
jgi:hypothetical protein